MNILLVISEYFHGEKVEALVFILSIGLLSLVFGAWLITEGGDFATGVAVPFVLMGLVMSIVGGVVGLRSPTQVKDLRTGLESQYQETLAQEISRIEKVNKAWMGYLVIWTAFAVVGLGLRFFVNHDFARGLGIALVFFAGVTFMIDGFAERRALNYEAELKAAQRMPGQ